MRTNLHGPIAGVIEVGDGVLALRAEAPDVQTLTACRTSRPVLERIGQRNELTVAWTAQQPAG